MSYEPPRNCSAEKARVLRNAHRHVIPGRVTVFSQLGIDLVMSRREGYRFWDVDGQEYLDFHLNGGVYTLGHRNPELLSVLRKAMETLDIGNHHFPSTARTALAELLTRVTPGNLQYTVFTSGGSEAIDVAIKSARYATGRRRIVALEDAYHGRTGLSGAAGDAATAALFHSDNPVEFIRVPFEDLSALEKALRREDVAAVLMETIPATSGFITPSASYLPGVKSLCERYGTLYIADEVQTGLGRTGRLWGAWLVEHGWGHPSSYGGAEVGCAVAHRVLEICSDPENLAHAQRISDYLAAGFHEIQQRHPYLRKVHRQCLVMGLEFDSPSGGVDMMKALYDRGLWAIVAGFNSAMLQVKPGFLIDTPYCDEALEHFETAITVAERLPKGKGTRFVSDGKSGGAVRAA
jgi:acetylornithine/succinyldiaminopimelate/putrescine aminotransferase